MNDRQRRRRRTRNLYIDGDESIDWPGDVFCIKNRPRAGGAPKRDHDFGLGHCGIDALQRLHHCVRDDAGRYEDVCMTRRCSHENAEPIDVVERIEDCLQLLFARGVASAIDMPDVNRSAKHVRSRSQLSPGLLDVVAGRCQLKVV